MAQATFNDPPEAIGSQSCPSDAELRAVAEGSLPDPKLDAILRHLAECDRCDASLAGFAEEQTRAEEYHLPAAAESVVSEPECLRMQDAIRNLAERIASAHAQPNQESTDKTRLSTDNGRPKRAAAAIDATTTFAPTIPRKIGRYEVRSLLGEGAYGQVFLAHDPRLDRQVAIKVAKYGPTVSRALIDVFLREAKVAARFKHPGIVAVYDADVDEGAGCYIVMEYVEGKSLKQVIAEGNVSHEKAADYIAQAADALAYAHKRDLVHRDIKPANLLLDKDGKIKVADFGLAIFEEEQRKQAGEFAGTLAYCSPEQIRGEVHHFDGRTDIWSLGVILYELLAGRRPFRPPDVADEILHRPAKPPRQFDDKVPADLERICLQCLSKEASSRTSTAIDLAHDLRSVHGASTQVGQKQGEQEALGFFATAIRRVASPRHVVAALLIASCLAFGAYVIFHRRTIPYDVDRVAVPFQPLRLLTREPRPPFPVSEETEVFTPYTQREALSLHTPSAFLLGLGETRSSNFRLRTDISTTDRSGAGLFFGFQPSDTIDGVRRWQCEMICLKVTDDGRFLIERMLAEVLESDSTYVLNDPAIAIEEVEPVDVRNAMIEVTIKGQSIVEVRWMGRRLPKLTGKTYLPPLPTYEGEFGVIGKNGTSWFHNAEFELVTPPSK